jgi:hypothetical protein
MDGPIPAVIQQFNQPVRDTHLVRKMYDGPSFPSTILPPYRYTYHLLEQHVGEMFPGKEGKFAWGHVKRGDGIDAFANAVLDVIIKGMLHYTNLLAGERSPCRKSKTAESSQES